MKRNNDEMFKELPWDNDFRIIAVPCSENCEEKHFVERSLSYSVEEEDSRFGLTTPFRFSMTEKQLIEVSTSV